MSLLVIFMLLAGCISSQERDASDSLTVEGVVSVRGHEPFTALVLRTEMRNEYVLNLEELPEDRRNLLSGGAPGRIRVTGELYKDVWNGMDYAHLRVTCWERENGGEGE